MHYAQRGFTLIELLVVIAIIGILSATVLTATTSSRGKANEAAIRVNMRNMQVQAEHYYLSNTGYGGQSYLYNVNVSGTSCNSGMFGDATISSSFMAADTSNGSSYVACYASGEQYFAATALPSGGYWCIDWTKSARLVTGNLPTSLPANSKCP
jgi:prepilin-type N-terminal cleavage/methylation domain-containing protein